MQAITRPKRKRVIRNPGLSAFAREQNVTVVHAWRVVMGQRESRRLLAAWHAYKADKSAA